MIFTFKFSSSFLFQNNFFKMLSSSFFVTSTSKKYSFELFLLSKIFNETLCFHSKNSIVLGFFHSNISQFQKSQRYFSIFFQRFFAEKFNLHFEVQ